MRGVYIGKRGREKMIEVCTCEREMGREGKRGVSDG